MIVRNQFFIVLVISLSLLIGNGEAGWKFWKKDEATTTTTTTTTATPASVNVQPAVTPDPAKSQDTMAKRSTIRPAVNIGMTGAANSGLAVNAGRNSARPGRPNPGTEVCLDFPVPRPNRPEIGGGNSHNYRDWAAEFTGAGRPPPQGGAPGFSGAGTPPPQRGAPGFSGAGTPPPQRGAPGFSGAGRPPPQNSSPQRGAAEFSGAGTPPPRLSQGPAINSDSRPQQPEAAAQPAASHTPTTDSRSTSVPGNRPAQQPIQQPAAGPRPGNTPHQQPPPQSTGAATRPTSVQPVQPHATPTPVATDQSRPGTPSSPSSGKSWADVAAGSDSRPASPAGLPRQPSPPGENARGTTGGRPTQPGDSRPAGGATSTGGALAGAAGAVAAGAAAAAVTDSNGNVYTSNPTYSKGNTVTDEDLEKLSEALYIKETNNANRYVTLNLQKKTTGSSPTDEAPQPLLTVSPEALQIPTVQRVLTIFDNYQLDTHTNEYISPAQRQEESLLVDTFLSTNVMSAAMRFLANKGFVRQDYYEYKDLLRRIWFNLFSRGQGKIGSTGFEHVFMAETRQGESGSGTEVLGLHNWVYFNAEETKRRVDYLGYIKKVDLGTKGSIVKMHARFNGNDKPVTAMFVGTSPELEMALYTVCFYARPDGKCPVSLGGTKFNIVTYKFKYRGKDLVGTAYPEI